MEFESRTLAHFSGVWGPLWNQNTCTLQVQKRMQSICLWPAV